MPSYTATEYKRESLQPTGREETYLADTIGKAVESLLYTRKLSNGAAFIGPTGRTVYSGEFCYSVTTEYPRA